MLMLYNTEQLRFFRPVYDCGPDRSNVQSAIMISVHYTAAVSTIKLFTTTIANMQTVATSFRSISRTHKDDLYAFCFGLILHKLSQLVERPAIMQALLRLTQAFVGRLTDARQVFQSNRQVVSLCLCYNTIANRVVNVFNGTLFFPTKPFQDFPRILSRGWFALVCLRLQRLSYLVSLQSVGIQTSSAELSAIRKGGNGINAQIHSKHSAGIRCRLTFFFDLNVQEVTGRLLYQLSRSWLLFRQRLTMVATNLQAKLFPLAKQGKAGCHQTSIEGKNTAVKVRTGWIKTAISFLFVLKGNCYTRNRPNCKISREPEFFPNIGIASLVQRELFNFFISTGIISHKVTSIRKRLQCFIEVLGLQRRVFQLTGDSSYDLHSRNLRKVSSLNKSILSNYLSTKRAVSSTRLKPVAFSTAQSSV